MSNNIEINNSTEQAMYTEIQTEVNEPNAESKSLLEKLPDNLTGFPGKALDFALKHYPKEKVLADVEGVLRIAVGEVVKRAAQKIAKILIIMICVIAVIPVIITAVASIGNVWIPVVIVLALIAAVWVAANMIAKSVSSKVFAVLANVLDKVRNAQNCEQ